MEKGGFCCLSLKSCICLESGALILGFNSLMNQATTKVWGADFTECVDLNGKPKLNGLFDARREKDGLFF
jgi:hypothetical protein